MAPLQIFKRRIVILTISIVLLILSGSAAFYFVSTCIEGHDVTILDSIAWTIITISTLGSYGAIELTTSVGRFITASVVFVSIGVIFVGGPLSIAPWLEEKLKRAGLPKRAPTPSGGHVIVCGYGNVGREVVEDLELYGVPYVVIESDPLLITQLARQRIPFVDGDPTIDSVLTDSNVAGASAFVAANGDEINAFTILSARRLNRDMRIVASLEDVGNAKVVRAAGADKVIAPGSIAGNMLGQRTCKDHGVDIIGKISLLDGMELQQYPISEKSPLAGKVLGDTKIKAFSGATVVAISRGGDFMVNPDPEEIISAGDTLIAVGNDRQLDSLGHISRGDS